MFVASNQRFAQYSSLKDHRQMMYLKLKTKSIWLNALFVPKWLGLLCLIFVTVGVHLLLIVAGEAATLRQAAAPCSLDEVLIKHGNISISATCINRKVLISTPDTVIKILQNHSEIALCDLYQDD